MLTGSKQERKNEGKEMSQEIRSCFHEVLKKGIKKVYTWRYACEIIGFNKLLPLSLLVMMICF